MYKQNWTNAKIESTTNLQNRLYSERGKDGDVAQNSIKEARKLAVLLFLLWWACLITSLFYCR